MGASVEYSTSQGLRVWREDCRDDQQADSEEDVETYALEELFVTVSVVSLNVGARPALTCAKKAMYQYGQRGFMIAMSMGDNADRPQAISTIHITGMRLTK